MPDRHPTLPSRQEARIKASICTTCFVAVPTEQVEKHQRWHEERSPLKRNTRIES